MIRANGSGTIDITDIVESMKSSFVLLGRDTVLAAALAIPGLGPFAAWFIKTLGSPLLKWALTQVANLTVMEAFFINTAMRKAAQAVDYVATVDAKYKLPPTATDDEYEKAELAEVDMFKRFVLITN